MTEYELLDLINNYQQTQVAVSMAFLTICSAFAAVIHFLGARLNRYLLLVFIFVYSAYMVLPITGILNASNRAQMAQFQLQRLRGNDVSEPEPFVYSTIVFISIWALTLFYAWYVRRGAPKSENQDPA